MFEQLEDLREKPPVTRWQTIAVFFFVFVVGMELGVLIGRRIWRADAWFQFATSCVVLFAVGRPV
ncbi:MAG TPA: hypothetical protein VE994_12605, partial [Terriglobales bacterium]|nr:hypothetical protein [Terriglobales bacterium]